MKRLIEMLKYQRPEGSIAQSEFNKRFLEPVFGPPDEHGNYIHHVGKSLPNLAFMAHHDTVHNLDGFQKVIIDGDLIKLDPDSSSKSDCLGADCTSGVWLILEMIDAQVPGTYIVHAGEEIGCQGSRALIANPNPPPWLRNLDAAISFDRKGYNSIITHQMGLRTCSDDFALSLSVALGMDMEPDPTGSYTDSNEYAYDVPECTNISVGYHDQHTNRETQDLPFLLTLRDALITADFSNLIISRDPTTLDGPDPDWWFGETLQSFVEDNPDIIADLLEGYGYDLTTLKEEIYGHRFVA